MNLSLLERGYNGNENLKRRGVSIDWTQELIDEYIKCSQDIIYFAEKYIKIVTLDYGLQPIVLYDYQKDIINSINDNNMLAVAASRQCGKTTTATVIILHYILFNDFKTVGLLANKGDSAREILERIKIAYEALPIWLQQGVEVWNKGSVQFENGCKIIACATSSSAIRGKSVNMLYIDETAFVERWLQFFSSVFPTLSSGKTTKIIMTSTPNGLNHFYKICMEAKEDGDPIKLLPGKNGYIYIEVKWDRVPGRDFAWMQKQLAGMSFNTEQFDQEFNVAWLGSSGTLISGSSLKAMVMKVPLQEAQGLSVFESPIPGKTYVTVVDVSRGKGLDYSAFQIIDVSQMPYNQVCVYKNNLINPTDYSEVIHRVCKSYNDSMILVEVNDIGAQVSDILHQEYEVDTLLFTESAGRSGKRISGGHGVNVDKGIRTTTSVKAIGCSILKMLIEQNQLAIHHHGTIDELSKFSRRGKSYEAEPGGHDDLVMPLVLFAWLTTQAFFKDITDINTIMRLREKTDQDMLDDLLPFGFNNHDDDYIQIEQQPQRVPSWMEWN